jgi:hypothetical protein
MHPAKLLALSLVIVLSPRVTMTDVGIRAGVSATRTAAGHQGAGQAGTTVASCGSARGQSGHAWDRSSAPKVKGRWGFPRRLTLLRRPTSNGLGKASCQSLGGPLTPPPTRSCSNWSAASGLLNR